LSAETAAAVRRRLEEQGHSVFDVRRRGAALRLPVRRQRAVKPHDFLVFNREFAALVKAGMPILRALTLLQERRRGSRLGDLVVRARERVEGGASLSEAFAGEEALVSPLYVTTVGVGEASGDLEGALRRYTAYLERSIELRKRVVGALVYPAVLLTLSMGVVLVLLTYVMPRFAAFYASYNAALPWLTRALLATSTAVTGAWPAWLALALVVVLAATFWAPTEAGRILLSRVTLALPAVGAAQRRYLGVQLTRTLAVLLRGGTTMLPALEATRRALSSPLFRDRLGEAMEEVRAGSPLHRALEGKGLLGAMAIEMIQVGESTGDLDGMLEDVAAYYDEALDGQLQTAVRLLEPALLVVVGLVIATVVLAVYMPLFNVVQAVR
jgi:type IV pilus assembly protein PilC